MGNLAVNLNALFHATGDLAHVMEAIDVACRSAEATAGQGGHSRSLGILAVVLHDRFLVTGELEVTPGRRPARGRQPAHDVALWRIGRPAAWKGKALDGEIHGRLSYRLVLAVDIEGYSSLSTRHQLRKQQILPRVLDSAASVVGLERDQWLKQAGGDGEIVVLPPEADVTRVVGDFVRALTTVLGEVNEDRLHEDRIRLRLAVHYGAVAHGAFGPAGQTMIVTSRLLDSEPLRRVLREQPDLDLACVVSESLYRDAVATGLSGLSPSAFEPVRLQVKGRSLGGYVLRDPGGYRTADLTRPAPREPAPDDSGRTAPARRRD
ncbi:hypothetical protein HUT06_21215 [Actinomadura sp. NAK00032]|uniref:hypothetical protein n=1 Tax=Actinomadura sp. NAK00032 TaxID=2742128 RepID=UPI0015928FDD|nr:hypothetical protein [Actinomadura sp. NAK00032]QKW36241.1 hypothetical protein HUT06_21215 [Actinomadura sp. NAK00032]